MMPVFDTIAIARAHYEYCKKEWCEDCAWLAQYLSRCSNCDKMKETTAFEFFAEETGEYYCSIECFDEAVDYIECCKIQKQKDAIKTALKPFLQSIRVGRVYL